MSVLIRGMKMPESCHECVAGFGGYCFVATAESDGICADHGRPDDCPLVELPPHGRLIDADALMEEFLETYTEYERKKLLVFYAAEVKQEVADMITDAPTIIPAEDGET